MGFKELDEWKKALIAFAISYAILYALQAVLGSFGLRQWNNNPTFYIMPIVGFFFAYLSIDWIAEFFETSFVKKPWFVIVFLIIALLAWHAALTFYMQNNVVLELKSNQQYQQGGALQFSEACKILEGQKRNETLDSFGIASCLTGEKFWNELKASAYLVFIIAAVFGWAASLMIKEKQK